MNRGKAAAAGASPASGPAILERIADGDPLAKIAQLKTLLDVGAITPDEFAEKKSALLSQV